MNDRTPVLYDSFFTELGRRLELLRTTAQPAVDAAADLVLATLQADHRTFVFGSGHSGLVTQDACVRAGSLSFFNPIFVPGLLPTDYPLLRPGLLERLSGLAAAVLDTADVAAGDCLVVISNSGRNPVPVEMAMGARERGISVIAVTGLETARSEPSRHRSGTHLHDHADVVIDTCTPRGDGCVAVPGIPAPLGPLSTLLGSAAMHALQAAVADRMVALGERPPVLASGNVDGGVEYSLEVLQRYAHLTTYLTGIPSTVTAATA